MRAAPEAAAPTAPPDAPPPARTGAVAPLSVLTTLFQRLDEAAIRYCHWKSNEHLGDTMTGATDVDVLVDRKAAQSLAHLLTENTAFKRFVVRAGRGYPGIEDYVGFDRTTGKLTHLHVHYQLTLGEKFLKGHRLPWEEIVLDSRVRDAQHGVYVIDPHFELLILVTRAAMKLRLRDFVFEALGRRYFSGSMLRELRWLVARIQRDRLVEMATPLVGDASARLLAPIIDRTRPSVLLLRAFRRRAAPSLNAYRLYSGASAAGRMWLREMTWIWWRVRNRLFRTPTKSTRRPPQGGIAVGFVGPDGAGKSTVTAAIARWLSREIGVVTAYGGSGTGTTSWARRWSRLLAAATRRPNTRRQPADLSKQSGRVSGVRAFGRLLSGLALARERRRWGLQIRRARSLGFVALSDRLPQLQFAGLNDGPRLSRWMSATSWPWRAAAEREYAAYRLAELVPPDLVIKLLVPVEVAAQRKPDTPLDLLRRKVEVVRRLEFPRSTRVVELDATQPLERVLLEVKQAIWDAI
jgi:thymidylate kinase